MQKLLATRGGTAAVAGAAALMAFLVFLLFMNQYRSSVDDSSEPVGVLIAKSLIPKGMSGDIVGTQELFQPTTAPKSQVKDGALTDPATLKGRVALEDIYPGQQLRPATSPRRRRMRSQRRSLQTSVPSRFRSTRRTASSGTSGPATESTSSAGSTW